MNYDYMKPIIRMYHKKTLWLLILSIVTAWIAVSSMSKTFGIDAGPRATFFLCFCVSFSAYQIVSVINKSTEALLGKASVQKESDIDLLNQPSAEDDSKSCMHCGKPLTNGAKFCMYCGRKQEADKE